MAETTTKFGAPTNFYVAEAHYSANHGFGGNTTDWACLRDSGVFVTTNPGNAGWESYSFGQEPYRVTTINKDLRSFGGLNMYTPDSGANSFALTSRVMTTYETMKVQLSFYDSDGSNTAHSNNHGKYNFNVPSISQKANSLWIRKTEAAFPTQHFQSGAGETMGEIIYATGLSLFDGDTNLQSVIIARVVDLDGSGYPSMRKANGIPYCDNGSIIFDGKGNIKGTIKGNNISDSCGTSVIQSIPDKAMVGNGGIAALSCMAKGASTAVWLSHRNGIYKLYQGTTPLIGMPGDKVTIKGHEFACLAYGPFYIRMS